MPRPLLGCALALLPAAAVADDVVLRAMRDELSRSMEALRMEALDRPYFVAYTVPEEASAATIASFGAVIRSNESRRRSLAVEVRVGDRSLDNTGYLGSSFGSSGVVRFVGGRVTLPMDDDYPEVRRQIWLATDATYKKALEDLSRKRAYLQTRSRGDDLPDFTPEPPATVSDALPAPPPRVADLEALARSLSAVFRETPDVAASEVQIAYRSVITRYANSEGTTFTRSSPRLYLQISAAAQAADGTPLEDVITVWARGLGDLPPEPELARRARDLGASLARRKQAPALTTYNGPVLFEGPAAAEVFAQVFVPRLLATRAPIFDDSRFGGGGAENPFLDRLGGRVLPEFLSVRDDPTATRQGGEALLGGYTIDDDGVVARPTVLVENGVLKTLLAIRTSVLGIEKSTGSRRSGGPMPSNLVVTASNGRPAAELKAALLAEVEDRGVPYGILIRRVGNAFFRFRPFGGPTRRDRGTAQIEYATAAFKVFPDGTEEPVPVAEITGLVAEGFREIVAASAEPAVHTVLFPSSGGPGLRAGPEAVSFVMPALLFREVSLKKPSGEMPRPTVASHPFFEK
jgi:hypothetical protein